MAWEILCTVSGMKVETLAKDLVKNRAEAVKFYRHAMVIFSPEQAINLTSQDTMLTQFSSQKCETFALNSGITASSVLGYFQCGSDLAVIIAEGAQVLDQKDITKYGKSFEADVASSTAIKKGYPLDCLGYSIGLIKSLTQAQTVAGL